MSSPGYLLVFSQPGKAVAETEFHDWYNNEHVPRVISTPGFLTAVRLVEVDGQQPRWAASYDLESVGVIQTPEYIAHLRNGSEREKDILSKVQIDWRVYELDRRGPVPPLSSSSADLRTPTVTVFTSLDVNAEAEEEFHRWYTEEHIPLLAKAPGWMGTRRFTLIASGQEGSEDKGGAKAQKPPQFLAVHEWDSADGFASEEYKRALDTPWRERIVQNVVGKERRVFESLKNWKRE